MKECIYCKKAINKMDKVVEIEEGKKDYIFCAYNCLYSWVKNKKI